MPSADAVRPHMMYLNEMFLATALKGAASLVAFKYLVFKLGGNRPPNDTAYVFLWNETPHHVLWISLTWLSKCTLWMFLTWLYLRAL